MSCLFSTSLNGNVVDIGRPDEMFSLTFAIDNFSGLFLHLPIKICINSKWFFYQIYDFD